MNIHIALYTWKSSATSEMIEASLSDIELLAKKIPGIIDICTGKNTSQYGEGFTHVILVRGDNQLAIDAYRAHSEHKKIAEKIEAMEEKGMGVDFESN